MTIGEIEAKLKAIADRHRAYKADPTNNKWPDCEGDHSTADALLCELLLALNYPDVVADFRAIDKWYA